MRTERALLIEEKKVNEARHDTEWAEVVSNTSMLKPFQRKVFRTQGTEVWGHWQHEGREVDLKIASCLNYVLAEMIVSAMNARQDELARKEQSE